jgi:hypothetical protein
MVRNHLPHVVNDHIVSFILFWKLDTQLKDRLILKNQYHRPITRTLFKARVYPNQHYYANQSGFV